MFTSLLQAFIDSSTLTVFVFMMFITMAVPFIFLFFLALRWIVSLLRTGQDS